MDEFDDIVLGDYAFDTNEPSNELPEQPIEAVPNPEDPKKVVKIKFDENLLLETKGIPLLRNESQYIQFQGKGHEAADLKKLMTYYTIWANNLYPKFRFKDFARKVGKQASKTRVKVVVEQWQNEYKDRLQARRDAVNELSGETVGEEDGSYRREEAESSDDDNRPLFIPLSKEAEEALAKKRKAKTTSRNPRKQHRSSDMINSDDDDEEVDSSSRKEPPRTITFSDSEDEEDDMIIKKKSKTSANSREHALALLAEKRAKSQSTSANGREHALAILAEKKKQRLLAQKRLQEQEEEEERKENIIEQEKSSDEDIDFDEQLRNIMSGKSSSKSKTSNSTDEPTKAQDKPSIYNDIVMEDIGDVDLDTIEMEDVEDDVLNNNDST